MDAFIYVAVSRPLMHLIRLGVKVSVLCHKTRECAGSSSCLPRMVVMMVCLREGSYMGEVVRGLHSA